MDAKARLAKDESPTWGSWVCGHSLREICFFTMRAGRSFARCMAWRFDGLARDCAFNTVAFQAGSD